MALGVEGRPQSCRFGTRSRLSHTDSFANPERAVSALSRRTQNGSLTKKKKKSPSAPPEWRKVQPEWEQLLTQNDENSGRWGWGAVDTLN